MAYEVKPWKKEGCSLIVVTDKLSRRETFSKEINEAFGEGGGLNANYRTVEAVARASNLLGLNDLTYGEDFIFKTSGLDEISFDFCDEATRDLAKTTFKQFDCLKAA